MDVLPQTRQTPVDFWPADMLKGLEDRVLARWQTSDERCRRATPVALSSLKQAKEVA